MPKRAKIRFSLSIQLGNYWTNQKMLLEGLITNCPGIKIGQKIGQKVLKNAKKSQNTFHLKSTVSKH